MNAQDLEQRAHEVEWATRSLRELWEQSNKGWEAQGAVRQLESFIAAALRQQPAPVDLEQFRRAVEYMRQNGYPEHVAEADRLLSIIDNAGKVAEADPLCVRHLKDCEYPRCGCSEPRQPAPVVDDARMARALEWVRDAAEGDAGYREYLPVVEEVFAAYSPSCGGRTVRVVDDATVGRACDAYLSNRLGGGSVSHSAMRDALTAAYGQSCSARTVRVVDDAMVQRALNAKAGNWPVWQLFSCEDEAREIMCIALTAALTRAQGVQS